MNADTLELIKKSAAVPSMPQVVARFLEIMQDPHFSYADLVKVLSVDPGTVSEILRLANSALFGVRNKIVSLRQALTLLGPKRTRSLVLGRYLVDTISRQQIAGLDMTYFWRRSLASSVIASRFAEKVLPRLRDEAFLAALLSDIGIPILAEAMPEKYGAIAARHTPHGETVTPRQENDAVGSTHGEVSGIVLAHWGLPEVIAKAVVIHQSQSPGDSDIGSIARILNGADRIAKLLCEVSDVSQVAETCRDATAFVGIDAAALIELLPMLESDIEELASVLRIDVIPSSVYLLIADAIKEALSDAVAQ